MPKLRMELSLCVALLIVCFPPAAHAERYRLIADPATPEGQYLALIGLQSTEEERVALLERFARKHPEHCSILWVYEQLQHSYLELKQFDRVIAAGEKLLAVNPGDLETAQWNAKAAVALGVTELAAKWSAAVTKIAQDILVSPPPKDPEQLSVWEEQVKLAASLAAEADHVLLEQAAAASDPREQIRLLDERIGRAPQTPDLSNVLRLYLNAYRRLGDHRHMLAYAERIFESDPMNEEALLTMAEHYVATAPAKSLTYSAKLISVLEGKIKRDAPAWDERKSHLAAAYRAAASAYLAQLRYADADKALRRALENASGPSAAPVLFYLGWANFKMGDEALAAKYYRQCAGIRGEFQEQALKNLDALRSPLKATN